MRCACACLTSVVARNLRRTPGPVTHTCPGSPTLCERDANTTDGDSAARTWDAGSAVTFHVKHTSASTRTSGTGGSIPEDGEGFECMEEQGVAQPAASRSDQSDSPSPMAVRSEPHTARPGVECRPASTVFHVKQDPEGVATTLLPSDAAMKRSIRTVRRQSAQVRPMRSNLAAR